MLSIIDNFTLDLYSLIILNTITSTNGTKFDLTFAKWILWDGRRKSAKERYKWLISKYGDKAIVIKNQKQLNTYIESISQ